MGRDDRDRFEAMFVANYQAIVRYAVRRVGAEAAHEITSETFLVAWRRFDEVPDYPLPWLYATARRLVANELRRRARAARLDERIESASTGRVPDPAGSVDDRLSVRAVLTTLSEPDQEVLRLAEWEQLTTAEIARVLGCSATAAKVRLHRARQRFGRALGVEPARARTLIPNGDNP